jgi:hypothetical protein
MTSKESGQKGKSVLEDKQKFDQGDAAKEKLSHMGDKPKPSEQPQPGGATQTPEK